MEPWLRENDKLIFYKYLDKCNFYFEYGSGGSTYQAAIRNNIKKIYSVESDYFWHSDLKKIIGDKEYIDFIYCDIDSQPNTWGHPGPKSTIDEWKNYSTQILKLDPNQSKLLDLILIDGRFRVACCLHCYDLISDNTYIAFDDFLKRPQYHIVLNYYDIIEKTSDNNMVILKKKAGNSPPKEIISKFEKIED